MSTQNLSDLVSLLRGPTLTVRTGLWLAPPHVFGQEDDEAARLGIDTIDIREPILTNLPEGTRFLKLSAERVIEALDEVCQKYRGTDCVLVCNLDLLVARLTWKDREILWQQLLIGFPHRSRSLLLLVPRDADHLQPFGAVLDGWRREGRIVG